MKSQKAAKIVSRKVVKNNNVEMAVLFSTGEKAEIVLGAGGWIETSIRGNNRTTGATLYGANCLTAFQYIDGKMANYITTDNDGKASPSTTLKACDGVQKIISPKRVA